MIDIKLIRENPKLVEKNLKKRENKEKLDLLKEVISLDKKRREIIQKVEKIKKERNDVTRKISELKRKGNSAEEELKQAKSIGSDIEKLDTELNSINEKFKINLMNIPNILHESVPIGKDDTENVVVKTTGKKLNFKFEAKSHTDILEKLGLLDEERAAKIAGAGFVYLKGQLVQLDYALMNYALDFLVKKKFTIIQPPFMLNRKSYEGVTSLEDFENVMYKIQDDNLYLIGTSEHPMAAMFSKEVLEEKDLPIKLAGISPCFRREVGTHGKYTKGLFRMHQFNKVEQFIFSEPEDSWKLHEELQKNSEDLLKKLGISFRVVNVCTGDIGDIAAKKYDIEFLMADGEYREIGSNSNCTDYQARRLNIKYKEKDGAPAKGFVHTLNNTAIATSRAMIAIIEQFQQKDGTVKIPTPLQKYTGFKKID